MDNQTPTGLKQLFQSICPEGAGVLEGMVASAAPLKIVLANDAKMVLGENSLIVPRHLTEYQLLVDVPDGGTGSKKITVRNSLKPGEAVYLLAFNKGKKYYVLDRKG